MIAALKGLGRWLWMIVLAVIAVTSVVLARSAKNRAERAHGRLQDAAEKESAGRWRKINGHLKAATRAEVAAAKRKAHATKALDAISATDPDMRRLLDGYNSRRRVRERPYPASLVSPGDPDD